MPQAANTHPASMLAVEQRDSSLHDLILSNAPSPLQAEFDPPVEANFAC